MKRTGLVLGVLAVVLITALWYLFLLKPLNGRIGEAEDQISLAQDEEVLLRTRLARLKKIQENELNYIAAIGALERAVPPTPEMAGLIDDLSRLADDAGVEWAGATYGNPIEVEDTDYLAVPITIQVSGQFFEILGYVYGINDLERIVRIDDINIAPKQEEGFTILDVTVTAKAFTTGAIIVPEFPEEETTTTTTDTTPAESTTEPTDTTIPAETTTTTGGG